jgi:hypothetical protein
VANRWSAFLTDNYAVRFGVLSPGLPGISTVTAHRSFAGHAGRRPIGLGWECVHTPEYPQNATPINLLNDRTQQFRREHKRPLYVFKRPAMVAND